MRTFKNLLFVSVLCLVMTGPSLDAQDFCSASWSGCNTNGSCTAAISVPSCNSMCKSSCQRFYVGPDQTYGCGNPGTNCNPAVTRLTKGCSCTGGFCVIDNDNCNASSECCNNFCNPETSQCGQGSPIMINLASSSVDYNLTTAEGGVSFDLFAEGLPLLVAWTQPDSDVALLALDRNNNGTIDDGSELFGNITRKRDGRLAANGFEALIDLDGGEEVSDGKIDRNDPAYGLLKLWVDQNHNGYSEAEELLTLQQGRVTAIFTSYKETSRTDENGNKYRLMGHVYMLHKNNRQELPRLMFDVFPKTARSAEN